MEEQSVMFEVLKAIVLWASPIVFLQGILLLIIKKDGQVKLEERLGKEIGGVRKKLIPKLETNIYDFQNWMLGRIFILSVIFIVYPILIYLVLKK